MTSITEGSAQSVNAPVTSDELESKRLNLILAPLKVISPESIMTHERTHWSFAAGAPLEVHSASASSPFRNQRFPSPE